MRPVRWVEEDVGHWYPSEPTHDITSFVQYTVTVGLLAFCDARPMHWLFISSRVRSPRRMATKGGSAAAERSSPRPTVQLPPCPCRLGTAGRASPSTPPPAPTSVDRRPWGRRIHERSSEKQHRRRRGGHPPSRRRSRQRRRGRGDERPGLSPDVTAQRDPRRWW